MMLRPPAGPRRAVAALTRGLIAPGVALSLGVAAACDGPTRPFVTDGLYVARAVGDSPLPAPIIQHETYERILLADTLRFSLSGTAERVRVHRDTSAGEAARIDTARYVVRFVVRGDSLRFLQYCPPNALCAEAPTGTFSRNRQLLHLQLWPTGPVVTFERAAR